MLELDKTAPAKGLEMSVVLKQHCTEFVYPTPYCLHFSNSHKEKYKQDIMQHIQKMQGTDKDLAAHFTVINHYGITLQGEDKNTVFSPVPAEHYIDSIIFDIENAVEEIACNPVYITLNLCRVLAYIRERKVLSKADGGIWGIKHLPQYSDIIKNAIPKGARMDGGHPAKRIFQAIRIEVNGEIESLKNAINGIKFVIKTGKNIKIQIIFFYHKARFV